MVVEALTNTQTLAQGEGGPKRVLLTGFEPFGGSDVNPSGEVVRAIADAPPAGGELRWQTPDASAADRYEIDVLGGASGFRVTAR